MMALPMPYHDFKPFFWLIFLLAPSLTHTHHHNIPSLRFKFLNHTLLNPSDEVIIGTDFEGDGSTMTNSVSFIRPLNCPSYNHIPFLPHLPVLLTLFDLILFVGIC